MRNTILFLALLTAIMSGGGYVAYEYLPGEYLPSTVRGYRNKNPGNLKKARNWAGQDKWTGLAPESMQTDSTFLVFTEHKWGIRACAKLLRNYQRVHGLNNVGAIINRWAPTSENNTGAYANAVAREMGVSTGSNINLDNANTLFALVKAVIRHENGFVLYTDSQLWEGINLVD